jgi:hypothetical protein
VRLNITGQVFDGRFPLMSKIDTQLLTGSGVAEGSQSIAARPHQGCIPAWIGSYGLDRETAARGTAGEGFPDLHEGAVGGTDRGAQRALVDSYAAMASRLDPGDRRPAISFAPSPTSGFLPPVRPPKTRSRRSKPPDSKSIRAVSSPRRCPAVRHRGVTRRRSAAGSQRCHYRPNNMRR